ncbi:MAG: hypothetical protein AB7R89_16185 [Dehalococcoidia bacterium]
MDEQPDDTSSWDEVIGSWRTPIRVVAGIGLAIALVVIVIRLFAERATGDSALVNATANSGLYVESGFFVLVAIGFALAIYIATRADD